MPAKRSLKTDPLDLERTIRAAAYARWVSRGMPPGTALDDWLAAEGEVLAARPARRASAASRKKKA